MSFCVLAFSTLALAQSFDAPLNKKVVDFGTSPHHPAAQHERIKLTCYYYPTFMVKQYDEGEKGAEWLSIAPMEKCAQPGCTKSHPPGEKLIDPSDWGGYFKGVKGELVFFDADDGHEGGLPFAIFEAKTARKIFEDTAYDSTMWNKKAAPSPFNRLRIETSPDQQIILRYLRVVEGGCDLHQEKTACWDRIRAKLELRTTEMPACSGYEKITERWDSAVAYPVEVSLFPQPAIKTIDGPVKCWPVD